MLAKESSTSPWLILPFILTLTIIPFIMGIYSFDPNYAGKYWYVNNSSTDLFLHYKSIYLTAMGAIMALIFIVYRFMTHRKFSFGIAMIPVYVYITCIVLSTCFSTSTTHSLHGVVHHFESTFVLLTYCVLVMYAAYFINNERSLKWFINGFLIGVALLVLFGLSQFSSGFFEGLYENQTLSYDSSFYNFMNNLFGCTDGMHWYEKLEPYKTNWMSEYLYMPTGTQAGKLSLNFPLGQVYLTLYNPNYVAFFTTLTAPFFATLAFFQEKHWRKVAFGLVSIGSILCLTGSKSASGFLSLCVSVVILFVAFRKKIFKHYKAWLIALGAFIVCITIFDFTSDHAISGKAQYVVNKITSSFQSGYGDEDWCNIRNIISSEDELVFETDQGNIHFTMDFDIQDGFTYTLTDDNGDNIQTTTSETSDSSIVLGITDEDYPVDFSLTLTEEMVNGNYLPVASLYMDGTTWIFTNQLHTKSYSYGMNGQSSTPFTVTEQKTDDTIGTYYSTTYHPVSSVRELLLSIATDETSLKSCFTKLASVADEYADIADTILNASSPQDAAIEYFNTLINDENEMYYFFYCMTYCMEEDNNYYYYNQTGNWTQIGQTPDSVIFDNYPKLASTRGYIWARSIPIMFKSIKNFLIGTGPDTYVQVFPHYDYVNLFRAGYSGKIITKPHSLYLQIGVQTGFVSMIAVLVLYILYLISCIKLYWKSNFTTLTSKVSVAILASITGYMVSGITNDSTVTYSFVYWGLIGVGIAVNRMEKKALREEQEEAEKAARLEQLRKEREERKKAAKAAKNN